MKSADLILSLSYNCFMYCLFFDLIISIQSTDHSKYSLAPEKQAIQKGTVI